MVTLVIETPNGSTPYDVVSGIESVLGGALQYDPVRAVDSRTWIAVGDGLSEPYSAGLVVSLRRTDPLDHTLLTNLASTLEAATGITVKINGDDVFHASIVRSGWAVVDRDAYPWIKVNVDLWLVNPKYVDGKGLVANGLTVEANSSRVYANGDML